MIAKQINMLLYITLNVNQLQEQWSNMFIDSSVDVEF